MAVEVTIRALGNSLGFTLPKETVKARNLQADEKIFVEVFKEADLKKDFGSLKRKMPGQKFKDLVREQWM
ncbi:MAG: hypothetical protein ABIA76_05705 [Candidatus Diapherotrites archaeon]